MFYITGQHGSHMGVSVTDSVLSSVLSFSVYEYGVCVCVCVCVRACMRTHAYKHGYMLFLCIKGDNHANILQLDFPP